eukprot:TRINITY_DN89289_c0_g1_i1.p1 TRINITY_DN89289_c0_g1~~TRINITY_DN89289_c0_g1_i1.p1  ORF type:complete len:956 (+),score=166.56 TRINITY_DN89289_c0_g1_i1:173-2869(+)
MVFDALWKAAQTTEACAIAALRACARWLHLQHASPTLRAQKKSGGRFCADLVKQGSFQENPLLQHAAQALARSESQSMELCRACADFLSEANSLTTEVVGPSRQLVLRVMETVVAGCRQLLPLTQPNLERWMEQDCELANRVGIMGRLVGELGSAFARLAVLDDAASMPVLNELADVARHYVRLRHTDLARCGLDFWYQVLAIHLGAEIQDDDPWDEDPRGNPGQVIPSNKDPEQELQRRATERPLLAPHIEKMVQAHWEAVRYPAEPEQETHFDWDEFARFREHQVSVNITEACLIVTPRWIIEEVGRLLEAICSRTNFGDIAWQDIDACIFVLTGVASRAPAGQDKVIPKLIELLPSLPYPSQGFKALLLRSSASRLVIFTTGYLNLNPEPCKAILKFLTMNHLTAIPALHQVAQAPDAKKYCEGLACDAMKSVMTAARKTIVQLEGGSLWREVITAVINFVLDGRYSVDGRAQLVFGIGQVLSVLPDWSELEQMLNLFVTHMQEPIQSILNSLPAEPLGSRAVKSTRDGKAPLELKLYIASVSSVYNMPPRAESLPRPERHPVLAVVEKHFPTIERVCLHHSQYEELMEQVCLAFSYILGFSKEYVPDSAVLVPMMKLMARCCEQHPQPYYMGLVQSVIGFFAAAANPVLDPILVDLTGLFIAPVARNLASSGGMALMPPPIAGSAYEMMAENVRHWNLLYRALADPKWMPEVIDNTVEALPRLAEDGAAVYERTITGMLRFLRNVLLWGDPETARGDTSSDLVDLQKAAQTVMGETPLQRGAALPRLISALARLLAAAGANNPTKGEIVPTVAEVYRTLVIGPFEYIASQQIIQSLRSLPMPLASAMVGEHEPQRLLQQLKMEKGDSRRFTKTVMGVAEQFAVALKKQELTSAS